jgi:hypothetical protein
MEFNYASKKEKEDLEKIECEILDLINQNPFVNNIYFLLKNPDLRKIPVLNKEGNRLPPNCLGTTFFIAGVSSLGYPYCAREDELSTHRKPEPEKKGPWRTMDTPNIHNKIPGALVYSYDYDYDWHAAIYLGQVDKKDIFFSQHGKEEHFGPESRKCFANPTFYIPLSLNRPATKHI